MKKFVIVLMSILVAAYCVTMLLSVSGCTAPPPYTPPSPGVSPTPTVTQSYAPEPSASEKTAAFQAAVRDIVSTSSCSRYTWGNRGKMPIGYMQGVAKVYAKALCEKRPILIQDLGSTSKDALAYYGKTPTLNNLFTLLLGLGPRESSGKYYEGRDMSADNTTSDKAEAGLFQTSWNSHLASSELTKIFNEYKAHPENCALAVFQQGLGLHSTTNYGSGLGYEFQKLSKECPAFAVEYAAAGLRVVRQHWGPINTKAAEFRNECLNMFQAIEDIAYCP